jgi:hypothetical protein
MGHYVYKYVHENEIIYIGKNDTDLVSRLNSHGKSGDNIPEEGWSEINNSDIYYCKLANSTMSDVVESELIRRYMPKYNKAKTSEWSGILFTEPTWIKFRKDKNVCVDKDKTIEILNIQKNKLITENEKLKDKIYELMRFRDLYFSLSIEFDKWKDAKFDQISDDESISFDEVCRLYKSSSEDEKCKYIANTYDKNGNLTSCKKIYEDVYGHLVFEFSQNHRDCVNGTIFYYKDDPVMKNYSILRTWKNCGSNEYRRIA